jgi:hypothetical protein
MFFDTSVSPHTLETLRNVTLDMMLSSQLAIPCPQVGGQTPATTMGKDIKADILHRTASAWGRRREEEIAQTRLIKRRRQPFL